MASPEKKKQEQQKKAAPPQHRIKACNTCYRLSLVVAILFTLNTVLIASRLHVMDIHTMSGNGPLQLLYKSSLRARSQTLKRPQLQRTETVVRLPLQKPLSWFEAANQETRRIRKAETEFDVISCRRQDSTTASYTFNADYCADANTSIIYYNALDQDRILCGKTIPAKSKLELDTKCTTPARLFNKTPDNTAKGMPPVQLSFDGNNVWGRPGRELFECDVPCQSWGEPGLVKKRYVRTIDGGGEDWTITFSMEGEAYYKQLKVRQSGYKTNEFLSTTSYQSEVPLPYFSWAEYKIQQPAVDFDKAIKGASFLARNCNSQNHREKIVQELENSTFRVDALSSCLHNAEPPEGVDLADKNNVMQHYLFYLAFENQCTTDYITEKLWGALESGTVPVYYGSPNVKEHVPTDSIVWVGDFDSTADLADYLTQVANSRELYSKHQAWRTKPLPPHFHAKYDFTEIHSTCRTCRWAYARFYGLGWDHANQRLRELETPRTLRVMYGLVKRPVIESWQLASGQSVSTKNTAAGESYQAGVLDIDGGTLRRTVWEQDGVIDMLIEETGKQQQEEANTAHYVLRLETPFVTSDKAAIKFNVVSSGHLRIQNDKTRYTILTWPRLIFTTKMNLAGGIVEMPMSNDNFFKMPSLSSSFLPLRVRILVEDIDTFHIRADEEENFFGKLMIRDFYNPVESFTNSTHDSSSWYR